MSTYCQLKEHKKDSKIYRRCSITKDKSLNSDECEYDTTKKACYTRKKKQPSKKYTKKNTKKSEPMAAAPPTTPSVEKEQDQKMIPTFYRSNLDKNIIQKYRQHAAYVESHEDNIEKLTPIEKELIKTLRVQNGGSVNSMSGVNSKGIKEYCERIKKDGMRPEDINSNFEKCFSN